MSNPGAMALRPASPVAIRWPAAVAIAVAVLSGCGPAGPGSPAASSLVAATSSAAAGGTASPSTGLSSEPVGVAVIGHSGATGYNSDPDRPGEDAEENSWATGTNPDVQSLYLRLLAQDPSVKGHNINIAIDGSDIKRLVVEAAQLVQRDPPPKLILVQTIDNDIRCDGTDDANLEPFGADLSTALETLSSHLPTSKIFVVSQWATVKAYDKVVFALSPSHLQGDGPCDPVDPATGKIVASKEAYLQGLVDKYWAVVTRVCGTFASCRTDGGAMQAMDLVAADLSSDYNHLSIAGHAKMAAMEWAALDATN